MRNPLLLGNDTVVDTTDDDAILALKTAIETAIRPEDLRQGLEVFAAAALSDNFTAPPGYRFLLEPTPFSLGLIAVLRHFADRGWHGDNITAMGMRIKAIFDTLTEYDWVAVNLFTLSEDHLRFSFDPRLVQAAAAARMTYNIKEQRSIFHKEEFINRLLYLLSLSGSPPPKR